MKKCVLLKNISSHCYKFISQSRKLKRRATLLRNQQLNCTKVIRTGERSELTTNRVVVFFSNRDGGDGDGGGQALHSRRVCALLLFSPPLLLLLFFFFSFFFEPPIFATRAPFARPLPFPLPDEKCARVFNFSARQHSKKIFKFHVKRCGR